MNIPEHFPGFSKKTLVVLADHVHARIFLGLDHELTFVEELKSEHKSPESGEHGAIVNEKEEVIHEDHLFHAIAKDLHTRLEKQEFEEMIIAAGHEVHALEKLLHPDVHTRVIKFIPKLLVEQDAEHILEHLF